MCPNFRSHFLVWTLQWAPMQLFLVTKIPGHQQLGRHSPPHSHSHSLPTSLRPSLDGSFSRKIICFFYSCFAVVVRHFQLWFHFILWKGFEIKLLYCCIYKFLILEQIWKPRKSSSCRSYFCIYCGLLNIGFILYGTLWLKPPDLELLLCTQ